LNLNLRLETPNDYSAVENLTREAFWNLYFPGCNEHYLVHILRTSDVFVPELDFVAVVDDRIVGNIMYATSDIICDDGTKHEVLTFGPLCVLPEYQRQGIGAALVNHTKAVAAEMGYKAIFIYGDPEIYRHVGFVPAEDHQIRTKDNMYAAALQVYELQKGALTGIKGRFVEDAVYEVSEEATGEFDAQFPEKEKLSGTDSQKRFLELITMRRSPETAVE